MSPLLQSLASPAWSHIVETLLHSLWQGAVLAAGLLVLLRFVVRPKVRYWLALLALAVMVAASLITWSVLQETGAVQRPAATSAAAVSTVRTGPSVMADAGTASPATPESSPGGNGTASEPATPQSETMGWTPWLAAVWLLGAAVMLTRAGKQLAGAGHMRRQCQPLPEGPVTRLLEQIQSALGVTRRIRVLVTDQITSPAVVGVLVPTLILPLSLTTTLSTEQLRFILLHELAHIRRGDYLVNLMQMLVEALLFFNPAVWWISRQIRLEREACCDATAIEFSGAPVEYARTLLHVAENYVRPASAALAFGDAREPSSLAERIRRLLAPGQRPKLRLTWRAVVVSMMTGGGLLVLSALGARVAVAAILTPEQRMDRIEKVLVAHGEDPAWAESNSANTKINFSGRVQTEDGVLLPNNVYIYSCLQNPQGSSIGLCDLRKKDGAFHGVCGPGRLSLSLEVPGYAPCLAGPMAMGATNAVTGIELVVRRGFAVTIQMMDADSGLPLSNATVSAIFQVPGRIGTDRKLITDFRGQAVMTNCASLPLDLTGNAAGYEIVQQNFASLTPGQILRLPARRGFATTGLVRDKVTGRPLAGAVIQVIRQVGESERSYDWDYNPFVLAVSDRAGRFATFQLRADSRYELGVTLAGHESVVFKNVQAGDSNLVARLGPELIVHGRVTGNLQAVTDRAGQHMVNYTIAENENTRRGNWAQAWLTNGTIYFQFTNRFAGPVELEVADVRQNRQVDAPVADWLVELTNAPRNTYPPLMREVVVRLKSTDGVPPRGLISVLVPSNTNNLQDNYYYKKVRLHNGVARLQIPVGANIEYAPDKTTLGYWFASDFNWTNVVAGDGPMMIDVPVIPAGVITARARNVDGSPAGGMFFSVEVVKSSPALENKNSNITDQGDGFSDAATPRQYVSPPLPLGGKYRIIGWRGNSFCASEPIRLTGAVPDQSVNLQFAPGTVLVGRVLTPDGRAATGATISGNAETDESHSFNLKPVFTDVNGEFRLTDCSPELMDYILDVSEPGFTVERVKVKFSRRPLTVRLQPGLRLTGKVLEAGTGDEIPDAEVRAWPDDGQGAQTTTHTDANGNYEFNTLAATAYRIFVGGANFGMNYNNEFKAGEVTNLVLQVTPYQGSQLIVKRP